MSDKKPTETAKFASELLNAGLELLCEFQKFYRQQKTNLNDVTWWRIADELDHVGRASFQLADEIRRNGGQNAETKK